MDDAIEVRMTADGVDWSGLKQDLAADDFDNGRTPDQLRTSFANSFAVSFVWDGERCVGSARLLSDQVCNAYLIDVWTASSHRRRGIAREMVVRLVELVPGQHVALFTEHAAELYRSLGFKEEREGMSMVVGKWLNKIGD